MRRTLAAALAMAAGALLLGLGQAAAAVTFPTPVGQATLSETKQVDGTFDGGMVRYVGSGDLGSGGPAEGGEPLFQLADGATLANVVIGAPAADGVHCAGSCTLRNVWWEDVGEDAATFRGASASTTVLVDGGGARHADDKVFQHDGGGTVTIRDFQVEDFGKLYRSCGNCPDQFTRHVVLDGVVATAPGDRLVGINANYGDTARLTAVTVIGDDAIVACETYTGVTSGEAVEVGDGPDGTHCIYDASDVTYR